METTFITRIRFTDKIASLIDQLPLDETPTNLVRDGLVDLLGQLDSNMRMVQPKKKNLWVSKHIIGTLEMRHDFKEGSPVHKHLVGFTDRLSRADALLTSPIVFVEVYKVSPGSPNSIPLDAEPIFFVRRNSHPSLSTGPVIPAHASLPSQAHDTTPSTPSIDAHPSLSAIPRPHGLPPKPASAYFPASATGKTSVIGGGVPISTVRTRVPASSASAGASLTKPLSLKIEPQKKSEASSSKRLGGSAPAEAASAMQHSSSSMPISTSGSTTPVLASAQPSASHPQPARSTTEPSGVIKLPGTDISGMVGTAPTHGKQLLDPSAFSTIGSSAAATSIIPHAHMVARTLSGVPGQSAFGPPPTAVSAFTRSASSRPQQKIKVPFPHTSAQGSPGPGTSLNQAKAAKSAPGTSQAEELAQSKKMLSDMVKTLDLEREKHVKELKAAEKRQADELEAARMKHGHDLVAVKTAHEQEVAEVRAQWAEDVRTTVSRQLEVDNEAKKTAEEMKKAHEQEVAGLRAQWADDVRAYVDRRLEVEKVAKETEGELKRAKEVHAREVAEVKAQWAKETRTYEAQQLEAQTFLRKFKEDIKRQVAITIKQAEMKATEHLETQRRELTEVIEKTKRDLENVRRDAEVRGEEVVGMKRKRVEMVGRLVRMRSENTTSPARSMAEEDEGEIISTIDSLESYIQSMRSTLQSEISSRQAVEQELRAFKDVDRESKEPFVVPAMLEAFIKLARLGDGLAEGSR